MSIYTQRFTRYDGPLEPIGSRYRVIMGAELRRVFADKWWRRFLFAAVMPAVMMSGWLYLMVMFRQSTGADLDFEFFQVLFGWQFTWLGLLHAWFGASMITGDMQTKALSLYFTRPIDATQYVMGKMGATMGLALAVTWAPAMLFAVVQFSTTEGITWLDFLLTLAKVTACAGGAAFTTSGLILLLSSSGFSARYVGIGWLAIFIFLEAVRGILSQAVGRSDVLDIISLVRLLTGSVRYYFGGESSQLGAVVGLWGLGVLLLLLLRVRLARFERARS